MDGSILSHPTSDASDDSDGNLQIVGEHSENMFGSVWVFDGVCTGSWSLVQVMSSISSVTYATSRR